MKTVLKIFKWFLFFWMLMFIIFEFDRGGIISGILFILLAIAVNPFVGELLEKKNIVFKRIYFIPAFFVMFIIAFALTPMQKKNTNEIEIETTNTTEQMVASDMKTESVSEEENSTTESSTTETSNNITEQISNEENKELQEEITEQNKKEKIEQETTSQNYNESKTQEHVQNEKIEENKAEATNEKAVPNTSGGNSSNFDTYDNAEQQNTTDEWVLNTKSKKIHYPACKDVKKISPDNYDTSNLPLEELENQGYSTCGHCFK